MRAARPARQLYFIRAVLSLGIVACITSTQAIAQDSTTQSAPTAARSHWLVGTSIGMPTADGEFVPELVTIGLQLTRAQPGRLGPDISVGTMPYALSQGVAVVGIRAGLALPLAVSPGFTLLPSGGVSLIGGASGFGAGGLAGFNVGGAVVVRAPGRLGARAGVTWHRFQDTTSGIWLLEIGFVRGLRSS